MYIAIYIYWSSDAIRLSFLSGIALFRVVGGHGLAAGNIMFYKLFFIRLYRNNVCDPQPI